MLVYAWWHYIRGTSRFRCHRKRSNSQHHQKQFRNYQRIQSCILLRFALQIYFFRLRSEIFFLLLKEGIHPDNSVIICPLGAKLWWRLHPSASVTDWKSCFATGGGWPVPPYSRLCMSTEPLLHWSAAQFEPTVVSFSQSRNHLRPKVSFLPRNAQDLTVNEYSLNGSRAAPTKHYCMLTAQGRDWFSVVVKELF